LVKTTPVVEQKKTLDSVRCARVARLAELKIIGSGADAPADYEQLSWFHAFDGMRA
jgi:hypothetical protein